MFWIKLLILNLILITSTIIGITFSKKYAYRVKELQEMKNALNIFMTKIKFTYEPLGEIFKQIIISRKSGQKIQKIANLQYYKSKANYGTKKKGISR